MPDAAPLVLDASVAVKWFFATPEHAEDDAKALALLEAGAAGGRRSGYGAGSHPEPPRPTVGAAAGSGPPPPGVSTIGSTSPAKNPG